MIYHTDTQDIAAVLRRMYYNERARSLYTDREEFPDFSDWLRDSRAQWERRRDEMAAGIVSLAEYRRHKDEGLPYGG